MRVILIHNPGAGDEDHSPRRLSETIAAAGHDVYRVMGRDKPLREELTGRADLVVVAGGDGTVREVFKRLAGRATPVAIIPVGTANNIARALRTDDEADPAVLVAGWKDGTVERYDTGRCYCGAAEQPFVEAAGAGLFAEVLLRAEEHEEPSGDDKIALGLRLLKDVLKDAPAWPLQVEVDGRDVSADLLGIEVTNVPETGPRVPLAPEVEPGDGLFEAVMIEPRVREALIAYVDARLAGEAPEPPRFPVHRGQRIALRLPSGTPLHLDDAMVVEDAPGEGIRGVAVTPGPVVRVLVPAPAGGRAQA